MLIEIPDQPINILNNPLCQFVCNWFERRLVEEINKRTGRTVNDFWKWEVISAIGRSWDAYLADFQVDFDKERITRMVVHIEW